MAYTDNDIQISRISNNVPDDYVTVRTTAGGFVFVDPKRSDVISAYRTGQLTGGITENAPGGLALRVLPPWPTPDLLRVVFSTPVPTPPTIQPTPTPSIPTAAVAPRVSISLKKSFNVPVFIEIIAKPPTIKNSTRVEVEVLPAEFPQQVKTTNYKFKVNVLPININISEPLITTANQFLDDIFETYVDEERELKTLLNYGEDKQSVVLAYRRGPVDSDGIDSIQLKLLQPVPEDITVDTPVFLGREVAKTTIDKIRVRFAPEIDATPYLRPKNLKVKADLDTGRFIRNVTLNKLSLQSGSVGREDQFKNKTFEDEIFRQWYSYDFNSSELNIDFTNYENFVFYSSAALRLAAFKQKVERIEKLEQSRKQILATYTSNTASAGLIYVQEKSQEYALEKENIIRAFDRYEQYLFFTPSSSNSAYSASFDYVDGGTEYNAVGYWPKSGSELWPVNSETAINWYASQSAIAQRFDEFNENNLINTIPTHVREDHDSGAYLTFVAMIGQLFDNIKLYVDQFPNIYSRNLNPNEELSKDLINEIAESIGFVMPSIDSVYNLTDNIIGSISEMPRRDLAAEIYKRLLHNLPFFAKGKGTKTALQTFLNTFGITPQLLTVKETGVPSTSSYSVFDEYTTGIDFDETSVKFIRVPILASNRAPTTLQFNCTVAKNKNMTILTGDDKWALNVTAHPSIPNLGRFEISSGSANTTIVSSSYYNIFGDELLNVTLQTFNNTSSFYFTQTDGDEILFNQVVTNSTRFPTLWGITNYVFMGGVGSRVIARYDGTLDEVRLWNTTLSDEVILNTAFDPGSNAGDTYSDAANHLLVQLSFNHISSASLAASAIDNESPYKDIALTPSIETLFTSNITESDFIRYDRIVKQVAMPTGVSTRVTNKIRVEPAPKFISNSQGLRLYRNKSIVPPQQKKLNRGRNKVILAVSPTDIVNQNIIRNLGLENINAVLGAPTTLYNTFEKTLTTLKNHYQQYYYVDVNTNKFIRILSDLASVLDQVVDYFIPSKATLLKGIIIEPNILEQVKIPPIKNIRLYGKNTRKTTNAANSLTGSAADYGATFNVSDVIVENKSIALANYSTIASQSNTIKDTITIGAAYTAYNSSSLNVFDTFGLQSSYRTYDLKNISWQEYRTVSNSLYVSSSSESVSGSRNVWPKQRIDLSPTTTKIISGGYAAASTAVNINEMQLLSTSYITYDLKNISWQEYRVISNSLYVSSSAESVSGSRNIWPKQKIDFSSRVQQIISTSYSPLSADPIRAGLFNDHIVSNYDTYDLKHLTWNEYRIISNSFVSGTIENISGSRNIWPKQSTNLQLNKLNKIAYNDVNKGKEGAEPYNRVYTRKLFNEEISTTRIGGNTSLYTPALNEIPPSADFRDFGVYTYFNNEEGIYYFNETKKIPTYPTSLNATWNFASQSFGNTATTWSYGSRYNKNDVVYQEVVNNTFVSASFNGELNSADLIKFSKGGNGKYYVFKTRPAYNNNSDNEVFYSGSVPSYIPPSLDKKNWEVLRFKPIQVRVPKRVVFDTYIISEPVLNNFKTTTISVDTIINIPDRYIDRFEIGSVSANSYVTGELLVQNLALLFAVQSSVNNLRFRLYRTAAARDLDITRNNSTQPVGSHGVLIDTILNGANVVEISNPIHTLTAGELPPSGKLFYTIDNLDAISKPGVTVQLYYFALEVEPRVPLGYLPKHYRFFRDNSTATKRRNFLGCKNTIDTTIDGLPPIQIIISEGTNIQVSDASGIEQIITGGGGTLNVT